MSKSITIPSFNDPFVVEVNNKKYLYPAGATQIVPDEVACVIDNINANMPKEAAEDGRQGQVWTKQKKSAAWGDLPIELPATGTTGNFLKKTATGCEWTSAPTYTLPAATTGALGGVKKASAVADATDSTDVITQFNALIASLVASGVLTEYVAET